MPVIACPSLPKVVLIGSTIGQLPSQAALIKVWSTWLGGTWLQLADRSLIAEFLECSYTKDKVRAKTLHSETNPRKSGLHSSSYFYQMLSFQHSSYKVMLLLYTNQHLLVQQQQTKVMSIPCLSDLSDGRSPLPSTELLLCSASLDPSAVHLLP